MHILLADDDPLFLQIGRKLLEGAGHTVVTAADGAEAWKLVSAETFPIVITDWIMPELDGLALCRRIREADFLHYTYVILATASGSRENHMEGLKAGADDFLVKPLNPEELAARLEIARRILAVQAELEHRSALLRQNKEELVQAQNQLAQEGTHDVLTGLKNQRFFVEALQFSFSLAARQGLSLSLILFAMEEADAERLKLCAQLLRANIRQYDLAAHCGQGEFGIILPATDIYTSQEVSLRLQMKMRRHLAPHDSLVTYFGAATLSLLSRTPPELLDEARQALQAARERGPNSLVHYCDILPDGLTGTHDSSG